MKHLLILATISGTLLCAQGEDIAYLTNNGDDGFAVVNDANHPYGTLRAAVDAVRSGGGTVSVAPGTYELTSTDGVENSPSCFVLDCAVKIVGSTGNPEDVVFKRAANIPCARVFRLCHADAELQSLTVSDGYFKNIAANGANVLVESAGGLVQNCIIANGRGSDSSGEGYGGGNIYLAAGRCSGCVISGGTFGNIRPYGTNVRATGDAVVENCLITGGHDVYHLGNFSGGAVCLGGDAKLINCSVVSNHNYRLGGVVVMSDTAKVVNCVIYGNTVDNEMDNVDNSVDRYDNRVCNGHLSVFTSCATDVDVKTYGQLNETCMSIDETAFVNAEDANWRLSDLSDCRDSGSDYSVAGGVSTVDLDGAARVQGIVDIGCYEHAGEFFVRAEASSYLGLLGESDTITFSVTPYCSTAPVSYEWRFGDGTTQQTTASEIEHQYRTIGRYTVSVVATSGSDTMTFTLADPVVISGLKCSYAVSDAKLIVGDPFIFTMTETTADDEVTYTWTFGDGTTLTTTETEISHAYTQVGSYTVQVSAWSQTTGTYDYAFPDPIEVIQKDLYVSAQSKNPMPPYSSWETAALKPNDAIEAAAKGCIIHIEPGNYAMAGITTRVNKPIVLQGEGEKPADTSLNSYTSNSGSRNMEVSSEGALVRNLQLYGGFCGSSPGGGNLLLTGGTVSNCVLSSGRARNHPVSAGGAYVSGGLLTHCVITNSFNGNREQGIILKQVGGRVSNCLLTCNKFEWDSTRNATSLCYIDGGVIDNCTIAKCWIMYNTPDAQTAGMYKTTDQAFNVTANGRAVNNAIADIRYCGWSIEKNAVAAYDEKTPQRWAGTAASFVKCVTDDAAPVNATCSVGTTATMFQDYANGDLTPGPALKNKGGEVGGYAFPSVDLAGLPRLNHAVDVGCYEKQPVRGMNVIFR